VILFRCDICTKETKDFWNIKIERTRLVNGKALGVDKSMSFDVCSEKCELAAAERVLSRIAKATVSVTIESTTIPDKS
jgi:hypothetical protein